MWAATVIKAVYRGHRVRVRMKWTSVEASHLADRGVETASEQKKESLSEG